MEITDLLGLILEMSVAQFRRNIPGVTRRSLGQRKFHIVLKTIIRGRNVLVQNVGYEMSWSETSERETSKSKTTRCETSCVRNVQVQTVRGETSWSKISGGKTSWTKNVRGGQNDLVRNIRERNDQIQKSGSETSWSKMSRAKCPGPTCQGAKRPVQNVWG